MEERGERWEEKGLGGKSTFKMEQELSRSEGSRERETMPFLPLTDRSHFIPEPRGDGWVFPVSPNWTALTSTQCSDNPHETTTCSCCSPFPLLAPLWHRFTPLFFLRKTFPKFKTLSWNTGEGE